MRSLTLTTLLLALPGCVIHEPTYQIIYTPAKTLTNNDAFCAPELPGGHPQPGFAMTSFDGLSVGVGLQAAR